MKVNLLKEIDLHLTSTTSRVLFLQVTFTFAEVIFKVSVLTDAPAADRKI